MEKLLGFLSPVLVYFFVFVLHLVLPGRWVIGYVIDKKSHEMLRYRLNGILVLTVVLLAWMLLCHYGHMPWDWFYMYRWYGLAGAVAVGMIFSLIIVLPYRAARKSFLADFFLGRLENPQLLGGRIDAKMWLYMAGAIMLELNVLSFIVHHYLLFGWQASSGTFLAAAMLSFFVIDYLTFEEVHLYTYDFVAESVGFKLGFGCLAFYPFFYSVPLWFTIDLPVSQTSGYGLVIFGSIFLICWSLSRGANMQKYSFKKNPGRNFLGIKPETISDSNQALLVNGFWGLSRHINYLGEIGMAITIVLAAGHPFVPWPWLYPLYYLVLLFTRQRDNDNRCALKYGALWEQYKKKVPYRIIPYIY
jgi:delta14-sterol reductase